MRSDAIKFADNTVATASGAAQSVANSVGGAFGGFASRFGKKRAAANEGGEPAVKEEPPRSMAGAAEELRVIKSLLDDGIINQDDYDSKKAELLGL